MTICYFGIYETRPGRNKIYIRGLLQNGAQVIHCADSSKGPLKFWRLFWKHWKIRNQYDVMVVGYPGHIMVPFAKLISRKTVVFDALCTMYEGVILSREQFSRVSFRSLYIRLVDFLAVTCADITLVESFEQKKYFEKKFGMHKKYEVLYTGADDSIFFRDSVVAKLPVFTVLFRGKFLPEAGVGYIIEAAPLLEKEGINLRIIGDGWLQKQIIKQIRDIGAQNIELITHYLTDEDMSRKMLECHVSLGQFERHERLSRTIPHKCFESLALGLPYITARTAPIGEILSDTVNCLLVSPSNSLEIAHAVMRLRDDTKLYETISENAAGLFQERFNPEVLARRLLSIIKTHENH